MVTEAVTEKPWCVYLLQSFSYGTYYIGITNNIKHRLSMHNAGNASSHTRGRRPWKLVSTISCQSKSEALKLEAKLKKLPKSQKESAFASYPRT
jgi:putative endonuclease